ncbi:MAG: hypothetical protein Q8P27_00085 [Candidatus Peregrinibacteria bacterium]|nr:hypothetical protein [Candidatus Peregrinibacteria bacterium]
MSIAIAVTIAILGILVCLSLWALTRPTSPDDPDLEAERKRGLEIVRAPDGGEASRAWVESGKNWD